VELAGLLWNLLEDSGPTGHKGTIWASNSRS